MVGSSTSVNVLEHASSSLEDLGLVLVLARPRRQFDDKSRVAVRNSSCLYIETSRNGEGYLRTRDAPPMCYRTFELFKDAQRVITSRRRASLVRF